VNDEEVAANEDETAAGDERSGGDDEEAAGTAAGQTENSMTNSAEATGGLLHGQGVEQGRKSTTCVARYIQDQLLPKIQRTMRHCLCCLANQPPECQWADSLLTSPSRTPSRSQFLPARRPIDIDITCGLPPTQLSALRGV
jgi:hypothetical protein